MKFKYTDRTEEAAEVLQVIVPDSVQCSCDWDIGECMGKLYIVTTDESGEIYDGSQPIFELTDYEQAKLNLTLLYG